MYSVTITERQAAFIRDLCVAIDPVGGNARADAFVNKHPEPLKSDASLFITRLLTERAASLAPTERAAVVWPEAGYYSVEYGEKLRFYRVKEGRGRFVGRKFLDRFQSDHLARISLTERNAVLALINEDPAKAAHRFSAELTRCYCCGRMLTDETSRLLGIGPDCRGRGKGHDAIGGVDELHDAVL